MASTGNKVSYRARYVFPVEGPPLPGGSVTIVGDRIAEVARQPVAGAIDLGDVAILPGFVNAHTHLEFSHMPAPLGTPGMPLPDWILRVIMSRRGEGADPALALRQGLEESLRCGTTTLGEIATTGWTAESLAAAPLSVTVFYELLGLPAERVDERLAAAARFLAATPADAAWQVGLSPHAPYSVHPELVVGLLRLAVAHRLPVAMHLAESREELELLAAGSGRFREMLETLGVWDSAAIPPGTRPLEYLQLLAAARRALVVHGNYLSGEEWEYLAVHAERMTVVYCPRTHAYFQHARYPLERALELGVSIALGTDSRASNPDLSLLAEMRHVARQYPTLTGDAVLRLGTLAGAQALGQAGEVGTLERGKVANLAIVPIESRAAADPHDLIFASDAPVQATCYRGGLSKAIAT